ncbi:hypothetical protein HAX54_016450 [Datura stramonium]|uniref:Uncharacterized protein n=1 Tax=Datura stramonium TaxID=4076 RepID=A0ABS8UJ25_DATST|nr:hypothetical protein [Datura stramonium]
MLLAHPMDSTEVYIIPCKHDHNGHFYFYICVAIIWLYTYPAEKSLLLLRALAVLSAYCSLIYEIIARHVEGDKSWIQDRSLFLYLINCRYCTLSRNAYLLLP